jgi:cation diffusion facilitator family transporter
MPTEQLKRNTLIALVASMLLAVGKFLPGIMGHSSALIADAVESLADTVGSIVVWQSLRVASRPPDQDHPYGYGKAEAIAAMAVGTLLLFAAVFIILRAFQEILTPHQAPEAWTVVILIGIVVAKEYLFRFLLRGAEKFGSDAAHADAWHQRTDAITSAAALIGVSIAVWGPNLLDSPRLVLADEAAALVASGIILLTAIRLMRPSLRELLDADSPDLAESVRATASNVDGVALVEKVYARKSGRGYHIDMHLHVAPQMGVREAHSLSGLVKSRVQAKHANVHYIIIHIEPAEKSQSPVTI